MIYGTKICVHHHISVRCDFWQRNLCICIILPEEANWGPKQASFYMLIDLYAPKVASSIFYIIWILVLEQAVHRCKIWSLPILGRVLNLLWRAGHFLPQIVHTNSPTAPIWYIFNGVELLLKNNSMQQRWKKTAEWLVFYEKLAEWLVFFEDLSHFPMEITTLGFTCTMCA